PASAIYRPDRRPCPGRSAWGRCRSSRPRQCARLRPLRWRWLLARARRQSDSPHGRRCVPYEGPPLSFLFPLEVPPAYSPLSATRPGLSRESKKLRNGDCGMREQTEKDLDRDLRQRQSKKGVRRSLSLSLSIFRSLSDRSVSPRHSAFIILLTPA